MAAESTLRRGLSDRARRLLGQIPAERTSDGRDGRHLVTEPLPATVRRAVDEALANGETHYADPEGIQPLREAMATYLEDAGYGVRPEQVFVTNGSREAIFVGLESSTAADARVALVEPVEPGLAELLEFSGREVVRLVGRPEAGFAPDVEDLESSGAAALVLSVPSAVAGVTPEASLTTELIERAKALGMLVMLDVSHLGCHYVLPPATARLRLDGGGVLLAGSLSISHALAGWRIGFLAAPVELTPAIIRLTVSTAISSPTVAQYAALEALTGPQDWISMRRRRLHSRRDGVLVRLGEVGLTAIKPDSFPGMLVDVRDLGGGDAVVERLAPKILLDSGARYGASTADYVRLNLLAPIEAVNTALSELAELAEDSDE